MNEELGQMLYDSDGTIRDLKNYIRITTYENGNVLFRLHYNAFLYDLLKLDSLLELQQYTGFYCSEREIDDILIRAIDGKIYCATLGIDYNSTNTHSELWEFAECDIQAVNDVSYAFLFQNEDNESKVYQNKYHLSHLHETLIQKRIHASTYRYFQEVKGWSDREVNLWMDQTFRDLYQAIDSFLDQHVDQKAYQNLSVLREFKIRAYNASAHDFRVLQLIDSHPALMFYYANRNADFDASILHLSVVDQLKLLLPNQDSPGFSYKTLSYCLAQPQLISNAITRQMIVEQHKLNVTENRFINMSKYDINQLRKLTTDKEWLLAMVIATFDSAELINLLISCPNLVQDYEALYGSLDDKKSAYSIQSPLMLIRDAYNGLKEDGVNLTLRRGITLKNLRKLEDQWHERLRIIREMEYAERREHISTNLVVYPVLDFVDYVCESHEEAHDPSDVYCLERLMNELDMFDEGNAMNHCVHTNYHKLCQNGSQCVYSFKTLHGKRIATVRMNSSDLKILESRGYRNADLIDSDKKRLERLHHVLKTTPKPETKELDEPIQTKKPDFLALPLTNAI